MVNEENTSSGSYSPNKEKLLIRISPHVPMKNLVYFDEVNKFVRAVDTSSSLLPNEIQTALVLYKNGVRSDKFSASISGSGGLLNERDKSSLGRIANLLKALEKSNSQRTKTLRSLNNNPDNISIEKYQEGQAKLPGNNLVLERSIEGQIKVASETYQTSNVDRSAKSRETNKNLLENIVGESIAKYEEKTEPIEDEITYDTPASYQSYVQRIVNTPHTIEETEETPDTTSQPQREMPRISFKQATKPIRNIAKSTIQKGGQIVSNTVRNLVSQGSKSLVKGTAPLAAKAAAVLAAIAALASAVGIAILVIILWTIILIVGFIFLTLIIVFIINTGAYVVPPGGFVQSGENPYVRVIKTSNPSGNVNNGQLTVNYEITISANLGSLSDIVFSEVCLVSPQGSCPSPQNIRAGFQSIPQNQWQSFSTLNDIANSISVITSSDPFIITYSRNMNFSDSRVTDVFSVDCSVENTSAHSSGSAGICFGDCPMGCFELTSDFPENYASVLNAAITSITVNHPGYVAGLCEGGTILIGWGEGIVDPRYCGWHVHGSQGGDVDIYLNSNCLQDPDNAEFIVGHESGHHFASVHPEIYAQYEIDPAYNEIICSYPVSPHSKSEDFAEMIGMYINDNTRGASCFGNNFCSSYPLSCQFTRGTIFSE